MFKKLQRNELLLLDECSTCISGQTTEIVLLYADI